MWEQARFRESAYSVPWQADTYCVYPTSIESCPNVAWALGRILKVRICEAKDTPPIRRELEKAPNPSNQDCAQHQGWFRAPCPFSASPALEFHMSRSARTEKSSARHPERR